MPRPTFPVAGRPLRPWVGPRSMIRPIKSPVPHRTLPARDTENSEMVDSHAQSVESCRQDDPVGQQPPQECHSSPSILSALFPSIFQKSKRHFSSAACRLPSRSLSLSPDFSDVQSSDKWRCTVLDHEPMVGPTGCGG